MSNYIWPLLLVVFSNVVYHIATKSVPGNVNPFASLTVTYLIGAIACAALYYILGNEGSLVQEYRKLNWAPFALGVVIVGLEAGWILLYKAGGEIGTAQIIQSVLLGVILIVVGFIFYKEPFSWNKLVGAAVCLIGLGVMNYK